MRIECLRKTPVRQSTEFTLPGYLQYLHHRLHQTDAPCKQGSIHAARLQILLELARIVTASQVETLGLAVGRHNHPHRHAVFLSRQ